MLPARSTATNPTETLRGFLQSCEDLANLGHGLALGDIDPSDVAVLHAHAGRWTVTFRETAPIEDLAYAAGELWKLLAIGPSASTAVPARPNLHLVR